MPYSCEEHRIPEWVGLLFFPAARDGVSLSFFNPWAEVCAWCKQMLQKHSINQLRKKKSSQTPTQIGAICLTSLTCHFALNWTDSVTGDSVLHELNHDLWDSSRLASVPCTVRGLRSSLWHMGIGSHGLVQHRSPGSDWSFSVLTPNLPSSNFCWS